MEIIKKNKLILSILAVAIAATVWYIMSDKGGSSVLTTQQVRTTGGQQELVDTLLQLRSIQLSGNILADPAFATLRDFGTPLISEPVGRSNPFAPLSAAGIRPTATTSSTR